MNKQLTEQEVRDLRDKVYGRKTTDNNWQHCKDHWMQPENVRWLLDQIGREENA